MQSPTLSSKRWCKSEFPVHNPAKRRNKKGNIEFYCQSCKKVLDPLSINPVLMQYLEEEKV